MSERKGNIPERLYQLKLPVGIEKDKKALVGRTTIELITAVVESFPEIQGITLTSYIRGLYWDEGYVSREQEIFWGVSKEEEYSRSDVQGESFWQERLKKLKDIRIPKDSPFKVKEIEGWHTEEELESEVYVAFCSNVKTPYRVRHIPLLDFKCLISDIALRRVTHLLRSFDWASWAVIISGNSYQAFGLTLLNEETWDRWLNSLTLENNIKNWWLSNIDIVDQEFLKHSLKDRQSRLRLTTGMSKPTAPKVIAVI